MGRNWMEAVCPKCPGNNRDDYFFSVLIGNLLKCPLCQRIIEVEPRIKENLSLIKGETQQREQKPLKKR